MSSIPPSLPPSSSQFGGVGDPKDDALQKISNALQQLQQLMDEPETQDWKHKADVIMNEGINLPLYDVADYCEKKGGIAIASYNQMIEDLRTLLNAKDRAGTIDQFKSYGLATLQDMKSLLPGFR